MPQTIIINEFLPNPELGSEWVELKIKENSNEPINIEGFVLFDNYHQIYKFSKETFVDQILVVEVSGLNNDKDELILKDNFGNTLDSFSYNQTEKGLSWIRDPQSDIFYLGLTSKNLENPVISPTPNISETPTPSPTIKITLSPSPSLTPTIAASNAVEPENNLPSGPVPITVKKNKPYHTYDLKNIKLISQQINFPERKTRLVLLGNTPKQAAIINAIIGSSLIIASAIFLIHAKIKSLHH